MFVGPNMGGPCDASAGANREECASKAAGGVERLEQDVGQAETGGAPKKAKLDGSGRNLKADQSAASAAAAADKGIALLCD